jgi:ABC-type branched-subunit amino acid transport system substrate-binding protein
MLLAACHHTRKTLVPEVPHNGDASARARFLEARSKFLRDGTDGEFAKIVQEYPEDPIAPWAELYAGIAAVRARDFAGADQQLGKVLAANTDPGLTTRARLFLGIAKNYEGDSRRALELLDKLPDNAIENDDERTEQLAALAFANAAERPVAALPYLDALYGRVQPAERAMIVQRAQEVAATLDPGALAHVYDDLQNRAGPSIAAVGSRLVLLEERNGLPQAAKRREDVAHVRAELGLPRVYTEADTGPIGSGGGGDPGLIGAVVPLGSSANRVAEAAIAGFALAAGAPDGTGVAAIETRAAGDKTAAAEAVDQLAHQNVIAIVGPIEGASVDAASGRADGLGVPLVSLATAPEQRTTGRFVYHIRHSAEARARVLAQRALEKGVKTFIVLSPDSKYGQAVTAAFAEAVAKGGGQIVKTVEYKKDAVSFASTVKGLGNDFQAVFVPDTAEKLGLIAPALAAAGLVAKPAGTKASKKGSKKTIAERPILLLSTAEDLTSSYLAAAGRHSEGAFLAPGFYPDDADPTAKPFIDRFFAAYGRVPTATEAYAYDAAQLAAAGSAGGRSGLAASLASSQLAGVTGTIQFDAEHRRADPGIVYTVTVETGDTGDTYTIRSVR